jgi:hypothetical protein
MIIKLLYPFANVMGLYFPVGKLQDGGTCEFATKTCLKECIALKNGTPENIIGYKSKEEIYHFFIENEAEIIVKQIIIELIESKCKILNWFASGDCPKDLTQKIFEIIKSLNKSGIVQNGFTRNIQLIKRINKLEKNKTILSFEKNGYGYFDNIYIDSPPDDLRIFLTFEKPNKQKELGTTDEYHLRYAIIDTFKTEIFCLIGVPDYKTGEVGLYKYYNQEVRNMYTVCGISVDSGGYHLEHKISEKIIIHQHLDCRKCYAEKTGCFMEIRKETNQED